MDSLFGAETPLAVRFFIAFIVVFALIGLTAWLIRRFGSGALGSTGSRGRAPRLAVIEAGAVDGRRKLVLIRRDNTEHLIMIGGPTDIVVESNIVRGQNTRDSGQTRGAVENTRAAPAMDDSTWPLQPEPAPRAARAAARPVAEEPAHWSLQPEPSQAAAPIGKRSRSADTLAGLAAELSVRMPEAAASPRPAPAAESMRPAKPAAADQNLADMAQRLEAALRRPGTPPAPSAAAPAVRPPVPAASKPAAEAPRVAPPVAPPTPAAPAEAPKSAAAAPDMAAPAAEPVAPASKPDNEFNSLEDEMASLLGRPAGKPT